MEHIRQSRPHSGLDFQVKDLETFELLPLRSEAVRRSGSHGHDLISENVLIDAERQSMRQGNELTPKDVND